MPDTYTSPLFIESIEEAIKEAVSAMGGAKAVGSLMRPEMLASDAGTWLSNCLNPDKRDKLSLQQAIWILKEARKKGYHGAINFICAEAGYQNPMPVEPEDEKARLMREFIEATKQQTKNVARMEQIAASQMRSA